MCDIFRPQYLKSAATSSSGNQNIYNWSFIIQGWKWKDYYRYNKLRANRLMPLNNKMINPQQRGKTAGQNISEMENIRKSLETAYKLLPFNRFSHILCSYIALGKRKNSKSWSKIKILLKNSLVKLCRRNSRELLTVWKKTDFPEWALPIGGSHRRQ